MAMVLIGREEERSILARFFTSTKAEFLALYGRRRIGKTFLVTEYFVKQEGVFFYTTGIKNAPRKKQIKQFTKIIGDVFYAGAELKQKADWLETFDLLTTAFNRVPKGKKIILFMDEFPWMATRSSGLLDALDYYWNRHWTNDKRIKLIICGSSASWIIEKIINNRAGLHNRITYQVALEAFTLKETRDYLYKFGVKLSHKQIVQIYMITGGIPFYLSKIEKGLSATQVIEALAFKRKSFLLEEFDNLFSSLFDNPDIYIKTIRLIANHRYGIGQEDLLNNLGKPMQGMGGLQVLKNLEKAGFIMSFKPQFHKRRGIYYRVIDEYVSFYLQWIEPIKDTLLNKSLITGYWEKQQASPAWYSWSGYAFEAVCYRHLSQISKALNLSAAAIPNTWRYVPKNRTKEQGAQIDLLFDRNDDAITICEIKYTKHPFIIDKQYAANLLNKIKVFKQQTRTSKDIFVVMVASNGVKSSSYSKKIISNVIGLDDLFK